MEIARRAIEHYSEPGDLVVDPLCTNPAVAVEAICHGRNAAAVIRDDVDARKVDHQLHAARRRGATGNAALLRGDPLELPRLLTQHPGGLLRRGGNRGVVVHPAGSVDLILVSLPAPLLLGSQQPRARQRQKQLRAADVLTVAAVVLRPGGYLVAVTDGGGATRDFGSETVTLCGAVGLAYWQHVVALLVPVADSRLQPPSRRPSRDATLALPRIVHQDVHVFRKPAAASEGAQQRDEVDEARRAA